MPIILVPGANTKELDILVPDEPAGTIAHAEKVIIPQAGHGSPSQIHLHFMKQQRHYLGNINEQGEVFRRFEKLTKNNHK